MSENNANLVWSIANLLRGPYKPKEYGEVVLPFTILRRLDCVLEPTRDDVLAAYEAKKDGQFPLRVVLPRVSKQSFYNTSRYSLTKLGDADHIKANLLDYLNGFSENVLDIFERFGFLNQIERLDENELLLLVTRRFAAVDLHPKTVSNIEMGLLFEELIRKFAESSNETAGEHFTPREVIKLMVELLFIADDDALAKPDTRRSIYDRPPELVGCCLWPTSICGTLTRTQSCPWLARRSTRPRMPSARRTWSSRVSPSTRSS